MYEILDAEFGKTKRVHFNLLKSAKRENVRGAPVGEIDKESSKEEVPFINHVPILPAVANAAVAAGTQNAVAAKTIAPNQQAPDHLATQSKASDNSAVPNAPVQSLSQPPAAIPDVSADNASTVTALSTVQPVAAQRGGAQRYDLRPRPKPSTRDAFLIIVALILLLPLAAGSLPISPLVGVARNSKNTLNYWTSLGSVLTWAALVIPLILALITLIRLIVKRIRKLLYKCNLASLATPSKVIKESGEAQEVYGCGRIDSKDPHMLIKPPLEVSQIINNVNVNQRHVHSDGITIVCLHPKCKILSIMALSIITISCLMSPLGADISFSNANSR